MSKISLQMYTLREHTGTLEDLDKTLAKLREIGFRKLQYSIPGHMDSARVKEIFDRYEIENDSVFCPSLALREQSGRVMEECRLFGTKYVRLDSMPASLSSSAAGYRMYAHYLNEEGGAYKKEGIKLLYHFHAFEFIRFGDTTGIEILLAETDPEVVQIIPDTHWIHSGGRQVVEFLEKYRDRYDYVHVKDFGIGQRGATLEARPICFAPVGEGNLDWEPILAFCRDNGVQSYAIEQDDCYGRDPFDCVASSYRFLKEMGVEDE